MPQAFAEILFNIITQTATGIFPYDN
jgi:hypothetical protein